MAEVAVIGVPDEKWGETVIALGRAAARGVRSPRPSSSTTAASAGALQVPDPVEFRDELARTATGKLQKYKLREPYWEGREKRVN